MNICRTTWVLIKSFALRLLFENLRKKILKSLPRVFRDENGFKCHTMSESHQRQLLLFADNPNKFLDGYSQEFEKEFMTLLSRSFGTKRVQANQVGTVSFLVSSPSPHRPTTPASTSSRPSTSSTLLHLLLPFLGLYGTHQRQRSFAHELDDLAHADRLRPVFGQRGEMQSGLHGERLVHPVHRPGPGHHSGCCCC